MNLDLVVGERLEDALKWCLQNRVNPGLAAAAEGSDIRLRGTRKPVVKLLAEPTADLMREVEARGGTFA